MLVIYLHLILIIIENALEVFANPIEITTSSISLSRPVWANLGVWAHIVGFILGLLFGIGLFLIRGDEKLKKPKPHLASFAIIVIGIAKGLNWVFKYQNQRQYILVGAAGFVFVVMIALLAGEFWKKIDEEVTKSKNQLKSLKPSKNYLKIIKRNIKSIVNDHRTYILLIFLILLFMSSFMIGATSMTQTVSKNNTVSSMGYQFWYEEESGLLAKNPDRGIYTILISSQELGQKNRYSFYVGNLFEDNKIRVSQSEFQLMDSKDLKNIWINSGGNWTNIYSSNQQKTELTVYGLNIHLNYTKTGLLEVYWKDNNITMQKSTIKLNENTTRYIGDKRVEYVFKDKKLKLKTNQLETILGKLTDSPPIKLTNQKQ
ncbi:hypothetical protein C9439_07070 [archaeon SCG-AAA382B04]|nr:hypothetical protein C9439_07070 [archaeon SCG-AAA382B04]